VNKNEEQYPQNSTYALQITFDQRILFKPNVHINLDELYNMSNEETREIYLRFLHEKSSVFDSVQTVIMVEIPPFDSRIFGVTDSLVC